MGSNPYQSPTDQAAQRSWRKQSPRSFVVLNVGLLAMLVAVPIAAWVEVGIEMGRLPPTYNGDPVTYKTTFHAPVVPSLVTLVLYFATPNCILIMIRRFRSNDS